MIKNLFFIKTCVFVIALMISQLTFAGQAGTVTYKTGDVSIIRADKTVKQAAKNDALNTGDTVETKDGRLQLALIDGGKVSLQPNTIYKINKYEFSGKEDGTEYGFTELIKGGLRTISGLIGHKNRDRYQLKTAVATIGIRGTEFTVNFNDNNLLMTTNHGSVDVCNSGGCLNAATGQSVEVAGVGAKPKPSSKVATASAPAPKAEETKVASNDSKDSKSNSSATSTDTSAVADTATDSSSSTAATDTASTTGSGTVVATDTASSSSNSGTGTTRASNSGNSGSGSSGTGSSTPVFTAASSTTSTGIPTIIATLKDGPGTIVSFAATDNGKYNQVFNADLEFNGDALKRAKSGNTDINPNKFASFNSDGIVAWGQAVDGNYNNGGNKIGRLDYIAGATPVGSLARLTGSTYTVFASTAPFLVSNANPATVTTIGASNLTGGSLFNFNFTANTFGYNITVPTTSYGTFNLVGTGNIGSNSLAAGGTVTNNIGTTCNTGCTGAFGSSLIQGSFLGTTGERIGLQYGIIAPGLAGKVYGGAVLK
ncbi:MAG: FecR domain-containing protein [Methylotenera sp.]